MVLVLLLGVIGLGSYALIGRVQRMWRLRESELPDRRTPGRLEGRAVGLGDRLTHHGERRQR